MKLSEGQLEQFNEEGFAVVENTLEDSDLAPVIQECEEHIDGRSRELLAEDKISQLYEDKPFER
jgi:hypothetical protein